MTTTFDTSPVTDTGQLYPLRWIKLIVERAKARVDEKRNRKGLGRLMKLDDQMLRDIGIARNNVRWVLHRPLRTDASELLSQVARGRL